jgi:CO/xanthine dehydrogenase Mo-binding subunit
LRARITAWGREFGRASESVASLAHDVATDLGALEETAQYTPPPGIAWDDDTYTGAAYPVFGWAACLVDLAIDLDTFEIAIERCVQAVDVGKAINPTIVRGQIDGGTLQALGWAVLENIVYKDGKVCNANMTNCIVPTFADAPELETIIIECPYPFGPHGAKGVGEIPMDGPAAAVANAAADALGVEFDTIPLLPEVVAARVRGGASGGRS